MEHCHSRRGEHLYRQLLRDASQGLSFSQDVMWEMGADDISYCKADFSWLFRASGPLAPGPRFKSRKKDVIKLSPHHTGPNAQDNVRDLVRVLPAIQTTHSIPLTTKESCMIPSHQGATSGSVKRTGLREPSKESICLQEVTAGKQEENSRNKWEEFVLKKLTKTTGKWIISQQTTSQRQHKAALQSLLRGQYGSALPTDLLTDESMCEEDFCGFYNAPKSSTEPKSLQSKVEAPLPHYRLQGHDVPLVCTDEHGGFNQTVNDVMVKHMETPKPARLQDHLNPHAGKYIYLTENEFEQELYSGTARQVHQQERRNQGRIVMDNNSEYQKNLQELLPCGPEKWTHSPAVSRFGVTEGMAKVEKGARRWVDLPTKVDNAVELRLRPPDYSGQETKVSRRQVHCSPMPEPSSLCYAVEDWRNAWKIRIAWQSVTVDGLKKALTDLHHHVRLAAIVTCASGAVNKPQKLDPTEKAQYGRGWKVGPVPAELQPLLLSALSDPEKRVRMAAAVCQYAMGTPSARARDILHNAIDQDSSGIGADGWVAAQCLAMEGEARRPVIERLFSQLFLSEAPSDRDQAATLLARICSKTTLVRYRLAEELNCANWRTRVQACNTISLLKCPINKDLANKLGYLMWNDWNGAVREAAAQALGRLDMGSDIHNELMYPTSLDRLKLHEGPASRRVEVLVLIGQLKIMTAKLLPPFLGCLNDDFVAVRKQACLTAASLMMKDEMIMDKLIELMQNDTSCDVKIMAINALGKIGCLTPKLEELLLWALHHEEEPRVRIAACEALKILEVKGPELQQLLQERYVLEPNPQVHRYIKELIKSYGYSLEGDKGMVRRITDQVQKLCSKSTIIEKVLLMEELAHSQQDQRKKLGQEGQMETLVTSALLEEKLKALKHSTSCSSGSTDSQIS